MNRTYKKPPVRDVAVIKNEKTHYTEVYFEFDNKILTIVHSFGNGKYSKHPEKHWSFPIGDFEKITRTFRDKGYYVTIVKKESDPFGDSDVISVLGTCSVCGAYGFHGQSGKCSTCN